MDSLVHVAPPSTVDHSDGPNAHPCRSSANRTSVTPPILSYVSGAWIRPTLSQVSPPFVVRSTMVQLASPHGLVPRSHPWSAETKLIACARKPSGGAEPRPAADADADPSIPEASRTTTAIGAHRSPARRIVRTSPSTRTNGREGATPGWGRGYQDAHVHGSVPWLVAGSPTGGPR